MPPDANASGGLSVGVSAVDITPKGKAFLGGFAPYYPVPRWIRENRWATGVHDPIWARSIAVRNARGETLLLMSTDLPGLMWKYINPARRELSKKFSVPMDNIVITSTHNHAGPDATGYWTSALKGHGYDYTRGLVDLLVESGAKALSSMQPAEMKVLTTTHDACYDPKTLDRKRGSACSFPKNEDAYDGPNAAEYDLPLIQKDKRDPFIFNPMITIIHFVKPTKGERPEKRETIATFINWHNHPDTLGSGNTFVSSDFPHYLREYVETELGGTAVYFSGTVGCQIGPGAPIPLWTRDRKPVFTGQSTPSGQRIRAFASDERWEKIRSIGYEIGFEVVSAIQGGAHALYAADAGIHVRSEPIDIAPTNFLHWIGTGPVWREEIIDAEDRMRFYPWRCMRKYGCVRSDVASIQLGELSLLTAPGEVDPVYLYGREASHATWKGKRKTHSGDFKALEGALPYMKGPHYAVLGQAQNYLSYMFPAEDSVGALRFKHPNHYEEFVTVNKHFGDDVGNLWMRLLDSPYRYSKRAILPKRKWRRGDRR